MNEDELVDFGHGFTADRALVGMCAPHHEVEAIARNSRVSQAKATAGCQVVPERHESIGIPHNLEFWSACLGE